ncbi:MAG TPA: tetratricopeptide repeat protein [Stenomitos sp.]
MRRSRILLASTLSGLALAIAALMPPAPVNAEATVASPKPKSDAPPPEGGLRLRREGPSIDLDSILDTTQPDFFINVEIQATPTPLPTPTATPEPFPAPARPTLEPTVEPSPEPTSEPTVMATTAPTPSPSPLKPSVDLMYQAQRLATLGQFQRALGFIDEAIRQDPDRASLHAVRGSLLFKLKDYAEAEAAWTKALELDPSAYDVKASLDWLKKRRASSQLAQ